jgi:hypothetical protein
VPNRLWPLIAALLALLAVVFAVLLWAFYGGQAGQQRGFIIRNLVSEPVVITFQDGQRQRLESNRQGTFVLKREDFPQTVTARTETGALVAERRFEYGEVAGAEFRFDVDRNGFFATREPRTITP